MTDAPPLHPVIYNDHAHLAGSLVALKAAVDAHWPARDTRSDGGIGDAAHQAEGNASDHNPWLNGAVRAYDFTATQPGIHGVDGAWLSEQLRMVGLAGDPRLTGGGYVIFSGHITAPDFSHWTPYTGADPHTTHVHVSVTRNPAGYEYTGAWAFLATVPLPSPPIPHPAPAPHIPAPAPTAEHPDLRGDGDGLRGEEGDQGPRVLELQEELNHYAPAYSHLAEDGVYGAQTAAVLDQYAERNAHEADTPRADRQGLHDADGRNVGPRLARALHHDGLI